MTTAQPSHCVGADSPLLLEDTITANLRATVAHFPDREALVDVPSRQRWTYAQFLSDVEACAMGLLALGVQPGDRIGIWSPNRPEWVLAQYGSAMIGAILVTINPAYRTHELEYVLNQSGISVLLSAPNFKTSDYRAMVAEVRANCPDLREVIFFDDPAWDSLISNGRAGDRAALQECEQALRSSDPINIQYTSGTTGFPKGATLTHRKIGRAHV